MTTSSSRGSVVISEFSKRVKAHSMQIKDILKKIKEKNSEHNYLSSQSGKSGSLDLKGYVSEIKTSNADLRAIIKLQKETIELYRKCVEVYHEYTTDINNANTELALENDKINRYINDNMQEIICILSENKKTIESAQDISSDNDMNGMSIENRIKEFVENEIETIKESVVTTVMEVSKEFQLKRPSIERVLSSDDINKSNNRRTSINRGLVIDLNDQTTK